ncbi:Collagen alpha-1(XXI) chain [Merluccius polli]|uniref:Collagen alpha-1(XXI) chain n=1 Tax=Merluccius polli TaxID=89951 RepID=A0AA47MGM6_MERPO|nr:Collagen alpha-1(XXI) chain [Merluccius polli]
MLAVKDAQCELLVIYFRLVASVCLLLSGGRGAAVRRGETVDVLARFSLAVASATNASVTVDECRSTLHIGQYASLTLPTQQVVGPSFAEEFSLLMEVLSWQRGEESSLVTLLDYNLHLHLQVRLGPSSLTYTSTQHRDYEFPVGDLHDGQWHRVSVAVSVSGLEVYVDCSRVDRVDWAYRRQDISTQGLVILGGILESFETPFEGAMRQLTLVMGDPDAARHHCTLHTPGCPRPTNSTPRKELSHRDIESFSGAFSSGGGDVSNTAEGSADGGDGQLSFPIIADRTAFSSSCLAIPNSVRLVISPPPTAAQGLTRVGGQRSCDVDKLPDVHRRRLPLSFHTVAVVTRYLDLNRRLGGARERAVQWGVEPSGTTAELGHTGAMWVLLDLLLVCLLLQDPLCLAGTHTGSQANPLLQSVPVEVTHDGSLKPETGFPVVEETNFLYEDRGRFNTKLPEVIQTSGGNIGKDPWETFRSTSDTTTHDIIELDGKTQRQHNNVSFYAEEHVIPSVKAVSPDRMDIASMIGSHSQLTTANDGTVVRGPIQRGDPVPAVVEKEGEVIVVGSDNRKYRLLAGPPGPGCAGGEGDLGFTGDKGSQGFPGLEGRRGEPGPPGPPGLPTLYLSRNTKDDWAAFSVRGAGIIHIYTTRPPTLTPTLTPDATHGHPTNHNLFKHPNSYFYHLLRAGWPTEPGDPGAIGETGRPGAPGIPGDPGSRGMPGHQGDLGYPGPKGVMGHPGKSGRDGAPGLGGARGLPGPPGLQGQRGLKGETAMLGEKGDEGFPGEPGPCGDRGNAGLKGFKGEQGDAGPFGPPGLSGVRGVQGLPGATGPQVHLFIYYRLVLEFADIGRSLFNPAQI